MPFSGSALVCYTTPWQCSGVYVVFACVSARLYLFLALQWGPVRAFLWGCSSHLPLLPFPPPLPPPSLPHSRWGRRGCRGNPGTGEPHSGSSRYGTSAPESSSYNTPIGWTDSTSTDSTSTCTISIVPDWKKAVRSNNILYAMFKGFHIKRGAQSSPFTSIPTSLNYFNPLSSVSAGYRSGYKGESET